MTTGGLLGRFWQVQGVEQLQLFRGCRREAINRAFANFRAVALNAGEHVERGSWAGTMPLGLRECRDVEPAVCTEVDGRGRRRRWPSGIVGRIVFEGVQKLFIGDETAGQLPCRRYWSLKSLLVRFRSSAFRLFRYDIVVRVGTHPPAFRLVAESRLQSNTWLVRAVA